MLVVMPKIMGNYYENNQFSIKFAQLLLDPS